MRYANKLNRQIPKKNLSANNNITLVPTEDYIIIYDVRVVLGWSTVNQSQYFLAINHVLIISNKIQNTRDGSKSLYFTIVHVK